MADTSGDGTVARVVRALKLLRRASSAPSAAHPLRADDCRDCGTRLGPEDLKCVQCGSVRDRPAPAPAVSMMVR